VFPVKVVIPSPSLPLLILGILFNIPVSKIAKKTIAPKTHREPVRPDPSGRLREGLLKWVREHSVR